MGSDFSTLDAELDTLEGAHHPDTLALANSYADGLSALAEIDTALGELGHAVEASSPPAVHESGFTFAFKPNAARTPASAEIALPEPIVRDVGDDASGEISLLDPDPRSGSFALDDQVPPQALVSPELAADETIELESDDLPPVVHTNSLFERAHPHFDLAEPARRAGEPDADRAFEELFSEATRQSSMPSSPRGQSDRHEDDTDIFDTSTLGLTEEAASRDPLAEALATDELNSDEFEIVDEDDDQPLAAHPSQPPEKRPSFLGRLFSRKQE